MAASYFSSHLAWDYGRRKAERNYVVPDLSVQVSEFSHLPTITLSVLRRGNSITTASPPPCSLISNFYKMMIEKNRLTELGFIFVLYISRFSLLMMSWADVCFGVSFDYTLLIASGWVYAKVLLRVFRFGWIYMLALIIYLFLFWELYRRGHIYFREELPTYLIYHRCVKSDQEFCNLQSPLLSRTVICAALSLE